MDECCTRFKSSQQTWLMRKIVLSALNLADQS